jgi:fumarate hydratase class II
MGAIDVPADKYWGAQTQRSLITRNTAQTEGTRR